MRVIVVLAFILMCSDASATNSRTKKAAEQVSEDAFMLVGITYLCGDVLTASDANSARSMAEGALQLLELDGHQAVIAADDFYQRTARENPVKLPKAKAGKCPGLLHAAQENLRASEAQFRKLTGK